MAKTKEKAVGAREARRFERIDLAAASRGISTALLKKLINEGKLTRYKLGTATMIDAGELETLIVAGERSFRFEECIHSRAQNT
jgi:hypothetical protein